MNVDDCTPAARVTRSLLGYGVLAGPVYVLASVVHGLLTPGFDFTRDSWSLLSLGPHGWVHVGVFLLTGLMVAAAGVGFRRHLRNLAGPALVAYGALLVVAGLARPDAMGAGFSAHGVLHLAAGGLGFVAFAVAAFSTARRFRRQGAGGWAVWSLVAGIALLVGFVGVASGSSSASVILGFTAAVVLSWTWLATVSVRLYREAADEGRIRAGVATPAPARR
jgi:hypothetical membrane protein